MTASNESLHVQIGDKVRVKLGLFKGQRGVVAVVDDDNLTIDLASGEQIQLAQGELTNYSLAARRAWQKMPKQAGRPKSSKPPKKMVSMRLDPDVWEQLGKAVELGYVANREEAINLWVREKLATYIIDQEETT